MSDDEGDLVREAEAMRLSLVDDGRYSMADVIARLLAENEKEKEHARQQTAEDEKALAELDTQRQGLRANINDDTLRHYDRVFKLRGSALSAVHEDQMCSVCRVMLRPQVFQDVMRGEETMYCDSCQRILYFVPPPPKPEGEAAPEPTPKKRKSKAVTEVPQEESSPADEAAAQ